MSYRELVRRTPELHVLLLHLLLEAAGISALLAVQRFGMDEQERFTVPAFIGLLAFQGALCVATILWARSTDRWPMWRFRLSWAALPSLGLGLMAGGLVAGGMVAFHLLVRGRGIADALSGAPLPSVLAWALPSWLLLVPLLCLKEELLFRAYTPVRLALAGRSATYAVTLSAFLFALIQSVETQPTPWQFVGLMASGLYASWLLLRTGSLWAPVGARAVMMLGELLLSGNPQLGGLWKYGVEPDGGPGDVAVYMLLLAVSGALVHRAVRDWPEQVVDQAPAGDSR